jgi:hypothetical protein
LIIIILLGTPLVLLLADLGTRDAIGIIACSSFLAFSGMEGLKTQILVTGDGLVLEGPVRYHTVPWERVLDLDVQGKFVTVAWQSSAKLVTRTFLLKFYGRPRMFTVRGQKISGRGASKRAATLLQSRWDLALDRAHHLAASADQSAPGARALPGDPAVSGGSPNADRCAGEGALAVTVLTPRIFLLVFHVVLTTTVWTAIQVFG